MLTVANMKFQVSDKNKNIPSEITIFLKLIKYPNFLIKNRIVGNNSENVYNPNPLIYTAPTQLRILIAANILNN